MSTNASVYAVPVDPSLDAVGLIPMAMGNDDGRTEEEGGCGTSGCTTFFMRVS